MRSRIALVALMATSSLAAADEHRIDAGQVPKPVIDAVAKKYPSAKRLGYAREKESGAVTYEVELLDGKRRIDVDLTPAGKIRAEEETIDVASLPASVTGALAASAKYRGWKVRRAERVITDENDAAPTYEVVVQKGRQRAEVVLDAGGKIVKEEAGGDAD